MSAFFNLIAHSPGRGAVSATRGAPIVLPLKAFYRREPRFERRRAAFYADLARAFGSQGWSFPRPAISATGRPGREGRPKEVEVKSMKGPGGRQLGIDRDLYGGVVEYLELTNVIDEPVSLSASDREKDEARRWGDIRRRVARNIRETDEGAQGSPLSSPDWMATPTGNAPGPTTVSDVRLWCMEAMGELHKRMPADSMAVINSEILGDAFSFMAIESREAKAIAIEDLRRALDLAAYIFKPGDEVTWDRLMKRWPEVRYGELRKAIRAGRYGRVAPADLSK